MASNDHPSLELNGSSLVNNHNNHHEDEKTRGISKWLGERLRVELVDGRSITGTLVCTDNEPNFILIQTDESWGLPGIFKLLGIYLKEKLN